MRPTRPVVFGQFRFDATNECLWQGPRAITLRPKAFAVLKYLLERPGQLVTKQQLLDAVWADTYVGDAVLKDSIRQLRDALGDDAAAPQYIETAHRRGYRFIGPVSHETADRTAPSDAPAETSGPVRAELSSQTDNLSTAPGVSVLGREAELTRMRGWLQRALRWDRQVVFVTGEPGIGKTTLVNALLEQAAGVRGIWMARGQCLEQYGAGEAYLPVLDALTRLGRTPDGERLIALLRQHAPAWLLELPTLVDATEREVLHRQLVGATRERMLRQMADAIEAMTAEAPLVLVLEDLHWSDYSTVDLLGYLARRRDPARLMVIGTYRPVDVIVSDHPLKAVKRELQAHGLSHELPLEYLTEEAVGQYLAMRCPRHQLPRRLTRLIHRRTEGNPLFMVNVVQYLIDEGVIVQDQGSWRLGGGLTEAESATPENVRQLIERQIERLSPDERTVLEGASVVGMECSSVAIAAGLARPTGWVEDQCEALVRRHQFLLPARLAELPDGTITPRYKFSHVLYLDVPYNLLSAMRRSQIHLRIGDCGEVVYGTRVGEIAAELAMHFEQGRDPRRAVTYLLMAAENAIHRSAHHESAALARRGLQALEALSETPERAQQEIGLQLMLGVSLMATQGFAAAEVEEVFSRALARCAPQGASLHAFWVQWLLGLFRYFRAEMPSSLLIAEQLLELATTLRDAASIMEGHRACGVVLVELGRPGEAMRHLETLSSLYERDRHPTYISIAGLDSKVVSECYAARALWTLGYPDRALESARRGLTLAEELGHVPSLVMAAHFAAGIHQLRGETAQSLERAASGIALADEYGLELWSALGHIQHGWARVEQGQGDEGIEQLQRGLTAYGATGARLWRGYFLGLLAEALGRANRVDEGLRVAAEALALVHDTGEGYFTPELHRIQGELLMRRVASPEGGPSAPGTRPIGDVAAPQVAHQAEACFREALRIARLQRARSWELRAVTSLGRLYQRQGRRAAARRLVTETYDSFTEGRETTDVKAAEAVLNKSAR